MNKYIIKGNTEEIDRLLIPSKLYDLTISRNTEALKKVFFEDTALCVKFVGFYTQLKNSNRLASERKCNCLYEMKWVTKYASDNNIVRSILLYNQQLEEYRYIIRYNYPSSQQSYIAYLNSIIFSILFDIRRFTYNEDNNLDTDAIFNKYLKFFKNKYEFKKWVYKTHRMLLIKK